MRPCLEGKCPYNAQYFGACERNCAEAMAKERESEEKMEE